MSVKRQLKKHPNTIQCLTEVPVLRKVLLLKLVLLHLQAAVQNLVGLIPSQSHVHGDFLVTPDPEGPDRVAGLRVHRGLPGKLLQNLGRTRQAIAGFTYTTIEDQFLHLRREEERQGGTRGCMSDACSPVPHSLVTFHCGAPLTRIRAQHERRDESGSSTMLKKWVDGKIYI